MAFRSITGSVIVCLAIAFFNTNVYSSVISNVTFNTPTGTVGPTDTIPLWMTLSLDPSSDPLTYDSSLAITGTGNLPTSLIPSTGVLDSDYNTPATFASYDSAGLLISYNCVTFTGCSRNAAPYRSISSRASDSWFGQSTLNMNGGDSLNVHVFDLVPTVESVPPGVYTINMASLGFYIHGVDSRGNLMNAYIFLGTDYNFTRTVSTVPIPAAVWLFGSGLMGLIGISRQKKV